jgi:hypothetical protein
MSCYDGMKELFSLASATILTSSWYITRIISKWETIIGSTVWQWINPGRGKGMVFDLLALCSD